MSFPCFLSSLSSDGCDEELGIEARKGDEEIKKNRMKGAHWVVWQATRFGDSSLWLLRTLATGWNPRRDTIVVEQNTYPVPLDKQLKPIFKVVDCAQ